jgi:hypothetical protein
MKIRDAVSTADTPMDDTNKNWSNRGTTIGRSIPAGANGVSVSLMGDDENSSCTSVIYVYDDRGPAQWVAGVTWVIGGQECIEDPTDGALPASTLKYADTITIVDAARSNSDQGWANRFINTIDGAGDNGVAQLCFLTLGAKWISFELASRDAGLIVTPIFKIWT